jgi:hypothetical protein
MQLNNTTQNPCYKVPSSEIDDENRLNVNPMRGETQVVSHTPFLQQNMLKFNVTSSDQRTIYYMTLSIL